MEIIDFTGSPAKTSETLVKMYWETKRNLNIPAIDYERILGEPRTPGQPLGFIPKSFDSAVQLRSLEQLISDALCTSSAKEQLAWGYRRMWNFSPDDALAAMKPTFPAITMPSMKSALYRSDQRIVAALQSRNWSVTP